MQCDLKVTAVADNWVSTLCFVMKIVSRDVDLGVISDKDRWH